MPLSAMEAYPSISIAPPSKRLTIPLCTPLPKYRVIIRALSIVRQQHRETLSEFIHLPSALAVSHHLGCPPLIKIPQITLIK